MIIIYGASGHAKVVMESIELNGHSDFLFIDDFATVDNLLGYAVSNDSNCLGTSQNNLIIAIGNNFIRKSLIKKYPNNIFINAIHPTASLSKRIEIGMGNAIMSNVSVNSGVRICNHCILNTNASIDHDCILEDFVHLSPNVALAGNVSVGEGTHIGIGASVIQGINIGKWATIGAGAVIINDIPDFAVVVGNPGRVIKFNENN